MCEGQNELIKPDNIPEKCPNQPIGVIRCKVLKN